MRELLETTARVQTGMKKIIPVSLRSKELRANALELRAGCRLHLKIKKQAITSSGILEFQKKIKVAVCDLESDISESLNVAHPPPGFAAAQH